MLPILCAPAFVPYSCPNKSPQTWGLKAEATVILQPQSFGGWKLDTKMLRSPQLFLTFCWWLAKRGVSFLIDVTPASSLVIM